MNDHMLTATQCKMARAALRWSMNDLAERASVSVNTIADFENGRDMPIPATLMALRQAFGANGVVRFTKDGGCGWAWGRHALLAATQCRVARAVLGWSMKDLAKRARGIVSEKTIVRFENDQGWRGPIPATLMALRQVFEDAGVRFTEEEGTWPTELLTATQCKMARAALRWSMNDLAERASVSVNTIADFEDGREMRRPATQKALRQAFEAAGVHFTERDGHVPYNVATRGVEPPQGESNG